MDNLPKLKFQYHELEPYIDAKTVQIHYEKHHAKYAENYFKAIAGTKYEKNSIEQNIANLDKTEEALKTVIRNQGGGYLNHNIYWEMLAKNEKKEPEGKLLDAINKTYNSFENLKSKFNEEALSLFGSGWVWLTINKKNELVIQKTQNQDNPLSEGNIPLFGIDLWEHAYYLFYQNKRVDYINNFWNILDFSAIEKKYLQSIS